MFVSSVCGDILVINRPSLLLRSMVSYFDSVIPLPADSFQHVLKKLNYSHLYQHFLHLLYLVYFTHSGWLDAIPSSLLCYFVSRSEQFKSILSIKSKFNKFFDLKLKSWTFRVTNTTIQRSISQSSQSIKLQKSIELKFCVFTHLRPFLRFVLKLI